MGLRAIYICDSFSAGVVFRSENRTSKDGPRVERVNVDILQSNVLYNLIIFIPSGLRIAVAIQS